MMQKILLVLISSVLLLSLSGSKIEKPTLNDVLAALHEAEVQYVERAAGPYILDHLREDNKRRFYKLMPSNLGELTIYILSNVEQRRGVQRDPCPNCSLAVMPWSYGMGNILVFYHGGDSSMPPRLLSAFKPLGVEERDDVSR